jgi:hypothetical protein
VVVLNGGLVPFILRQAGTDTQHNGVKYPEFTIHGDSYVHGLMDGEAIDQLEAGLIAEQSFVLV